jgi:ectoine hydroxylase-related dioxygenase (phytanoyl-CoA dioxygenase family)
MKMESVAIINNKDSSEEMDVKNIFQDVLKVEKEKRYLDKDHHAKKVGTNLSISTAVRKEISNKIGQLYPNKIIESPFSSSFPLKKEEISSINRDLDSKGFFVLKDLLDNIVCDSISKKLERVNFNNRKSVKKIRGLNESNVSKISGNTAWVTNQQDVLRIPEIQKIAFNENLLNLVGKFLGSEPILCQTNSWWTVSNSTHRSNLSANSQMFHQDMAYLKFIKVFIYLTDVDEDNGPHQYVQGTSKIAQDKLGENYQPSDRVEDEKVDSLFGKENVITFQGKKGSIIIEDTFGLHKGTAVKEGSRLLIQLLYCNSLYFHAGYSFGLDGLLPEVNDLLEHYPRVFSNFVPDVDKFNEEKFQQNNKRTISQKLKDKIKSYL